MPSKSEQPPRTEVPQFPFLMASRFESKETSQAPYDTIQAIVREYEASEFSVFRMIQNWPETMSKAPTSPKRWYVAVIGHAPPAPLLTQVTEAIQTGEPVPYLMQLSQKWQDADCKRPPKDRIPKSTGQ